MRARLYRLHNLAFCVSWLLTMVLSLAVVWAILYVGFHIVDSLKEEPEEPAQEVIVEDETAEEEVLTMEDSAVSGSAAKPSLRHDEQITTEDDAPQLKYLGTFVVTAYCACEKCCGKWADGITSTGTVATQGRTIAVDPRVIPYGTVLYFEGHDGLICGYIAEDCGGSIKGNRIDLFFDSHEAANEWGIKVRDIYVIA